MKSKGGKREGSGRKPGASQTPKSFRIDNDLVEWLAKVGNQNFYINTLIRKDLEWRKQEIARLEELLKT